MKLLLYCTKEKMKLRKSIKDKDYYLDNGSKFNIIPKEDYSLNGKIVAECDFEVEEMEHYIHYEPEVDIGLGVLPSFKCDAYCTKTLGHFEILKRSCLDEPEIFKYLGVNNGYAIHIKNLKIFDKPKELSDYCRYLKVYNNYGRIEVAPQNMMYAYEIVPCKEEHLFRGVLQEFRWNRYNKNILISIQPQWLCKILNGEKTIEVRKKVLKGMI